MKTANLRGLTVLLLGLSFVSCTAELTPEQIADNLRESLISAQPGDVIDIPEGVFAFSRSLSLTADGVTIRGAGMDKTVLTFKDQAQGAEGLLVSASDFTVEDLAVEDTKGDAIKVNEGTNIVFRNVRTEWTNGPDTKNGSYGLYPVQTENVLIDGCVAIGASDAGIYVGQSRNVIVRNSRAEYNVAGIEIENTVGADVYDNVAVNNTGGILVFNMPDLPQEGHSTRVFRNEIRENNTANFAPEGTAVASVLAGSGVVITANDKVEIFENTFEANQTAHVVIASNYSTNYSERETVEGYDPFPEEIFLYGNEYSGGGDAPAMPELEAARTALFGEDGRLPAILWDGFANPEKSKDGELLDEFGICSSDEVEVFNADAPNGFAGPRVSAARSCEHTKLAPIALASDLTL
ncbi:MAG: parallel beta-helix domain-containing protein [Acidobacteriota bacterium]